MAHLSSSRSSRSQIAASKTCNPFSPTASRLTCTDKNNEGSYPLRYEPSFFLSMSRIYPKNSVPPSLCVSNKATLTGERRHHYHLTYFLPLCIITPLPARTALRPLRSYQMLLTFCDATTSTAVASIDVMVPNPLHGVADLYASTDEA